MKPNPGYQPTETRGKRVRGYLCNGRPFGFEPVTSVSPLGWDARTTRWTKTDSPFDVDRFEVCK